MTNTRIVAPFAAAILLAACGSPDGDSGMTSAEERQLDEAAAALDEAQADYEAAIQAPDPTASAESETQD
ncbi:hypothetical protein [Parasphingopyxis lamellibrachiae]|uniref:Uncharacterized protein n=1 Tax=Parasphingopyxis lamellibrachiae TaxID=680125 RepID=A0A3D9FJ41_9SPHN|nr:hypothetical protein [Parasphingopyxis lamellibrachiae]RED17597.1 hypothetical protein DFR46_2647 [Parasphingopyxis lamellibrachiae]